MFLNPPREKGAISWLFVGIWSLFIYIAIPLARTLQTFIEKLWGRATPTYLVWGTILISLLAALGYLWRTRRMHHSSLFWLIGTAVIFGAYTLRLSAVAVESVHFVQYGILGVLLFRALSHQVRDISIYLDAALIGGSIGILDEFIQWLTPGRYWGLDDIWINFLAVALVQVGIAKGFAPPYICRSVSRSGLRRTCRLAMLGLCLLGASLLNTPPRILWYAEKIPGLAFLAKNESVMLEFGYRYADPQIGSFKSRFSPQDLKQADRKRGPEAAAVLDRFKDRAVYEDFLEAYTPLSDPFLHEARVHLFRRNYHLAAAGRHRQEPALFAHYLTIAFRENQILETYFPHTLQNSAYVWTPQQKTLAGEHLLADEHYESRVSHKLVTRISDHQMALLFGLALIGLILLHRRLKSGPDAGEKISVPTHKGEDETVPDT